MISPAFLILSLLSSSAFAFNDWSVPCFDGKCSYDSDAGSIRIWGSTDAITDITAAGGWTILNCEPDALVQDIRLVCQDGEACSHFWASIGPVGKIVRLPEDCGANAFARISRVWEHADQSIPEHIRRTIVRRQDEGEPVVQGVALDTDFAAVDPAAAGEVGIAIEGSNIPGAAGDAETISARRRSVIARHNRRALFDFIEKAFDKFNSFDKDVSRQLPPINVSKSANLFDQSISCPASGAIPAFTASVKADVTASANAVVTLGASAEGTLVPPKLDAFGLYAGLNAELKASLNMKGSASGTADSGKITFFQVGIPGLDFPGILTIGPTFKLQGQATATLELGVNLDVDLVYSIKDTKLFFPKSANHASTSNVLLGDSPLKLSATPSLSAKGVVSAHVIPVLDIGVSALGGIADATIFLNLDASATMTLTLDASAEGSVTAQPGTELATGGSASINGCVDMNAGFSVNAGADATFFGLFDTGKSVTLFEKDFDLFEKCFGATTKRRSLEVPSTMLLEKRAFACPGVNLNNVVALADETATPAKKRSISRSAKFIY